MDPKLCRVCLDQTATVSLFSAQDGVLLSAKMLRCAGVRAARRDGRPAGLCARCAADLAAAYDFVQRCEASDRALRYLDYQDYHHTDINPDTDINADTYINPVEDADNKSEIDVKPEDDIEFNLSHDYADPPIVKEEYVDDTQPLQAEYENAKNHERQKTVPKNGTSKKLGKRQMKRTKSGPLQCVICGQITVSRSAMEAHMRTHTGESPYSCQLCTKQFRTKGSLTRHFETRHAHRERKFTCETCGSSFYRKNDIIIHMRVHTDERPYSCPYCSRAFRQVTSLIRHKRVHTGEKPFGCPICGKKFADKNLVKKHQSVHSDERKYQCHLCNKSVKTKNALNTHMILHTNEKQIICNFCGMAFNMKGNLQTHIRRVHSEKSGQCSVCLKTFSDLEVHMRKHTGEKPFLCKLCKESYATKRSLSRHMMFKHENATKFKCSVGECTRTFPTAVMLEFHLLKQHSHSTPYVCPHCARGFFRPCDLTRHLKGSHMDLQTKLTLKREDI